MAHHDLHTELDHDREHASLTTMREYWDTLNC